MSSPLPHYSCEAMISTSYFFTTMPSQAIHGRQSQRREQGRRQSITTWRSRTSAHNKKLSLSKSTLNSIAEEDEPFPNHRSIPPPAKQTFARKVKSLVKSIRITVVNGLRCTSKRRQNRAPKPTNTSSSAETTEQSLTAILRWSAVKRLKSWLHSSPAIHQRRRPQYTGVERVASDGLHVRVCHRATPEETNPLLSDGDGSDPASDASNANSTTTVENFWARVDDVNESDFDDDIRAPARSSKGRKCWPGKKRLLQQGSKAVRSLGRALTVRDDVTYLEEYYAMGAWWM
ncbi:hypothetical protein K461DRAFT_316076 [Myriangium duriaei CBS 260.36]|uniref:Uncharacterized protein n=1 Tax=Myriangium duriaei CBS 260.36 TaxID=1168546 RepID=A0A9P4MFR9_9PEZI|nr:hypothetical protein K461DRAFT_316076 [Myriangium duriaei CBS 260.36]